MTDSPLEDDLETIASFSTSFEANLAKACLEDAGLRAFIASGEVTDMAWHLTNAVGGVKLQVRQQDAREARALLEERRAEAGNDDDEQIAEAEEDAPTTTREENAARALRAATLGLLLWPLQLYVLWLLIKVCLSHEWLGAKYRRQAWLAAAIAVPVIVAFVWILQLE